MVVGVECVWVGKGAVGSYARFEERCCDLDLRLVIGCCILCECAGVSLTELHPLIQCLRCNQFKCLPEVNQLDLSGSATAQLNQTTRELLYIAALASKPHTDT